MEPIWEFLKQYGYLGIAVYACLIGIGFFLEKVFHPFFDRHKRTILFSLVLIAIILSFLIYYSRSDKKFECEQLREALQNAKKEIEKKKIEKIDMPESIDYLNALDGNLDIYLNMQCDEMKKDSLEIETTISKTLDNLDL